MKGKISISRWVFGTIMLLAAAFVVANQVGDFAEIGIVSIVIAALAAALIIQCIVNFSFAVLPFPLGVLYFIFQEPFELPYISFWVLGAVVLLLWIGLYIRLPKKHNYGKYVHYTSGGGSGENGDKFNIGESGGNEYDRAETYTRNSGDDNNPSISVSFGGTSRYLHSDSLESAHLDCKFGALEVFLDHAQLSPNGAVVYCNCNFGSIEISVPKFWRVKDEVNCTLGGVEANHRRAYPAENAPELTIKGNVAFGAIEIKYI